MKQEVRARAALARTMLARRSAREQAHMAVLRGTVTAEFALILPVIALMVALLLGLGSAVGTRVSCQDAAAAAARTLLSTSSLLSGSDAGDDAGKGMSGTAQARRIALQAAPHGSTATIARSGDVVRVTLSCPVGAGKVRILPMRVGARAAVELPVASTAADEG